MKFVFKPLLLLLLPFISFANNNKADTILQGVLIESTYSGSVFPKDWQGGSINATGEQISSFEWQRAEPVIIAAVKKYPQSLLSKNLRAVYLLKSMKFYNVGFGGTNSSDAVYVTDDGETMGYTNYYIEQTFHHEFSSILFRNYPSLLDTVTWKLQNERGFDYNDPDNGVGAIRNNQSSQTLDTSLAAKGFLTQYAMSSLENDLNTLAQNLFRPAQNFWTIAGKYPRVGTKVRLLIAFYNKINPVFTEQHFKTFAGNNN